MTRIIQYPYTAKMTILLDKEFCIFFTGTLDKAVNRAEWAMDEYNFNTAEITDATGRVLATIDTEY